MRTLEARTVRPYQADALSAVGDAYREGHRSPLVVMPTGTGKTIFFAELARRVVKPVLFVTHTRDLVRQTAKKVGAWCEEDVGIEMAASRELTRPTVPADALDLFGGPSQAHRPRLGVASVQTLASGTRLDELAPDAFGYVVFDEAHHATANTWRQVAEHFSEARLLGVTATPDRADGKALGQIFDCLAFEYEIRQAITDGWLCPVKVFVVQTKIDLDSVKTKRGGDFQDGDLEDQMRQDAAIREIGDPIIKERGDRPTVVFCAGVAHAEELARYLCHETKDPNYAAALSGKDELEQRDEQAARLARGELKVLTNCQLFTEGWDCPPVSLVVMARPTKSRPLYAQMMGRGTRIFEGKTDMVCMDFAFNSDRHKLVTAVDIFQGDFSDDVADVAKAKAEAAYDPEGDNEALDVMALEEDAFADFTRERAEILYTLASRDPFASIGIDLEAYQEAVIAEPVTEKQRALLEKNGLKAPQIDKLSKRKATLIIGRLMERRTEGLCTPKQARILARSGVNPGEVRFDEAGALIDFIAAGGWKPLPAGFDLEAWRLGRERGNA